MDKSTAETILARVQREPERQFSPTRYPYTYAADMLRTHPEIIPDEVAPLISPELWEKMPSRAEASGMRRVWAEFENRNDSELAFILADAYLKLNRIDKSAEVQR